MKLKEILQGVAFKLLSGSLDIDIHDIKYDSRKVEPNDIYVALVGFHSDGHDYIKDAIKNGANTIVVSKIVDIKEDINKSIIKYYFSDAIAIMCDVMCAINNVSQPLQNIINDINDIIYDSNGDREIKTQGILDYFNKENIIVRIPCLLMPEESKYNDSEALLDNIKRKVYDAFKDFKIVNEGNLDIEIVLLVFPIRDLKTIRRLFLEVRKK